MLVEISGGDVRVIATLEEISRVSGQLRVAAEQCRETISRIDWLLEPNLFRYANLSWIAGRAEQLAARCELAREQYHEVEVGNTSVISRVTETTTGWLDGLSGPGANNPLLSGFRIISSIALTIGTGLAGTVHGTGPAQTESARAATQFAPRIFGTSSPQTMLQRLISNLSLLGVRSETSSFAVPGAVVPMRPAGSIAEHVKRLAHAYQNPASGITVESYQHGAARQFVVYVPGTQSAALGRILPAPTGKQGNPFDLRSNLNAMASPGLAASEQAVQKALATAGAGNKPGDRVLFVGHSQGALISANIASTEQRYKVSGLISIAGPIGHLDLSGVPTLALEHDDDPVPALSGGRNPLTAELVTVRAASGQEGLIAAHSIESYRVLAREVDTNPDAALRAMIAALELPATTAGTSQQFLLRRDE